MGRAARPGLGPHARPRGARLARAGARSRRRAGRGQPARRRFARSFSGGGTSAGPGSRWWRSSASSAPRPPAGAARSPSPPSRAPCRGRAARSAAPRPRGAVAVFGAAAPAAGPRAEPAAEVLARVAPAPGARALAHPAAEEDAEPSPTNARLLLGGGAGAPIISAPVPRRSHHVLRNSRALDAAAVGGRAGAGLRRRRAL